MTMKKKDVLKKKYIILFSATDAAYLTMCVKRKPSLLVYIHHYICLNLHRGACRGGAGEGRTMISGLIEG